MPTQVQNTLLPPIQKVLPPKVSDDPAPRRGEEFGAALKTARKKSDDAAKNSAAKETAKDTKAEPKKDKDDKATGKTSAKQTAKSTRAAKQTKTGKTKTDKQEDSDVVDETDDESDAGDPAAATATAEAAATDQAEETATPQTKVPVDPKDDPEHSSHTDQKTPADDAAAAQLVQPVDRAKDQTPRRKDAKEEAPEEDDADAVVATVKNANGAAKQLDAAQGTNAAEQQSVPQASQTDTARVATGETEEKTSHGPAVAPIGLGGAPPVAPKTSNAQNSKPAAADPQVSADFAAQLTQLTDLPDDQPADTKADKVALDLDPAARAAPASQNGPAPQVGNTAAQAKAADAPPLPPEVQFAESNHEKIVSSVQTQLLPHGGAMQIRLDPPELGALHIMVEMRDGVMSATFQTSNEEATQLLSHSLNQLKHVLESQGVSVERLQVQQAPKGENSSTKDDSQQQQRGQTDDHAARQEQQRKEMMRRMWRRVSGAGDPIDYLA